MSLALSGVLRRFRRLLKNIIFAFEQMLLLPASTVQPKQRRKWRGRSLDELAREVEYIFTQHLTIDNLLAMSKEICRQLNANAKSSEISMLPSFTHTLPAGNEKGTYLALDVGGSTLRISLVELTGKDGTMITRLMRTVHIAEDVKLLQGKQFFAWMAEKIDEVLSADGKRCGYAEDPLPTGLSWSFPLEQTSVASGRILPMGKGFHCSDGTIGLDLGDILMEACWSRSLNIKMEAIVNDSTATLLSRAYSDPSTRTSLILGTGTNAAIHFPTHAIGSKKFGKRDPEWFARAKRVIVNTELSMYGGNGILARSRWDETLNREHIKPDFQPLEYMCTGNYLGEIVRLVAVEAVKTAGLFGGILPRSMESAYSFDSAIVSFIEADDTPGLTASSAFLQKLHTFSEVPSAKDMMFLRTVCKSVSKRAAAYIATAVYSLQSVCNAHEASLREGTDASQPEVDLSSVSIACDGAVILKYPGFRQQCQAYLDQLVLSPSTVVPTTSTEPKSGAPSSSVEPVSSIRLDLAPDDSTIYGAAVAAAVAVHDNSLSNTR